MKIFILFCYGFPNGAASAGRVSQYCHALQGYGCDAEILIPIPTENVYSILNTETSGVYKNIYYKYFSSSTVRSCSFCKRRWDDFVGHVRTIYYLIQNRSDNDTVLMYPMRTLPTLVYALVARTFGIKIIYELNELPYVTQENTKITRIKRNLFVRFVLPIFNGVFAISHPLYELLSSKLKKRSIIVPIMVNLDELRRPSKFSIPTVKYILHTGSLTDVKDGISGVIEAFGEFCRTHDEEVYYYSTGTLNNSTEHDVLRRLISQYKLEKKVVFLGYLSETELRAYQKSCLLTVVNKLNTLQNKYCFATKLGEYMGLGKPIITTNVGEARNYLRHLENAFIIPPDDKHLLTEAIREVVSNPGLARIIGEGAEKTAALSFNLSVQGKRIKEYLINIHQNI